MKKDHMSLGNRLYSASLMMLDYDASGIEFSDNLMLSLLVNEYGDELLILSDEQFSEVKQEFIEAWQERSQISDKRIIKEQQKDNRFSSMSIKHDKVEKVEIAKMIAWIEEYFTLEELLAYNK